MEDHEKAELKIMFKGMLDEQTKVLVARMDKTDATLAPIAAIYDSTKGFSSVMRFLFKNLIVPVSIVVGFVLTIKELFLNHPMK